MANLALIEKIESVALSPKTKFMMALAASMPQGVGLLPAALVRAAVTSIKNNPKLQRCDEFSLFTSIAEVAQSGLSLDKHLGQASLVPYGTTATVLYGYRGLCELARRSGEVTEIVGEIRYEKDEWLMRLGSNRELIHVPSELPQSKRGAILGAYAVATLVRGLPMFEYMTLEQIEKIRDGVLKRKKGGDDDGFSPWTTNFEEMARKTAIRRLAKRLPQSASLQSFVQAAVRDEYRQAGHVEHATVTPAVEEALKEAHIEPQADNPPATRKSAVKEKAARPDAVITTDQVSKVYALVADLNLESTEVGQALKELGHAGNLKTLPASQLEDFMKKLCEKGK